MIPNTASVHAAWLDRDTYAVVKRANIIGWLDGGTVEYSESARIVPVVVFNDWPRPVDVELADGGDTQMFVANGPIPDGWTYDHVTGAYVDGGGK